MECSKLFSGDLPEMTNYIIKYLKNDLSSLYSCVLVNRFWCRIAIPVLWEDPFSITWRDEFYHHFLDIYFLFLNDDDKTGTREFRRYKISHRMNSFSFKPLFNYPSFIKTLNTYQLELHVVNWLTFIQKSSNPYQNTISHSHALNNNPLLTIINNFNNDSIIELNLRKSTLNSKKMINVLCILLTRLFMNNNASLNNLDIRISHDSKDHFFVEVYDSILEKPEFISDIKNFTLEFGSSRVISLQPFLSFLQLQPFLSSLSSILSSIKNLNFYLRFVNNTLLTKNLANVIQSQTHLSSLTLSFATSNIVYLFDAFEHCSKTLTSIKFLNCDFTNILSFEGLKYLTQLKFLHFINCLGLKLHVIQPLLDMITPLRIKSLTLTGEILEITLIQLLLQKIGIYLENLFLNIPNDNMREKIFESIIQYCDKIKFLHLNHIDFINIPQIYKIISHLNNNLKYLTLEHKIHIFSIEDIMMMQYNNTHRNHRDDLKVSSMILRELGQRLPNSLEYLDLNLAIDPIDLKNFLNNCKHVVELKKLLIRNRNIIHLHDTLNVLKEYVRENNLENLSYGINNPLFHQFSEIEKLKLGELVKETQILVKMKKYEDLIIKVCDFDEI